MQSLLKVLTKKRSLVAREAIYPGMFDLPKGIFMLFVFFQHAIYAFYSVWGYRLSDKSIFRTVGTVINLMNSGMLSVLFLSCGYTWRKKSMKKAIQGQISAIVIPYLITGAAVTAFSLIYGLIFKIDLIHQLRYDALPFLLGFCPRAPFWGDTINSVGPIWCVVAYFFSSILLNWILQEKEIWIQLCLVLLLSCVGLQLQDRTMVFCFQQTLVCTGYLYFGWLMKKTNFFTREIPTYLIILIAAAGPIFGAFGYFDMSQHLFENGMVDLIACLLMGITLLVFIMRFNHLEGKILEFFRWMGRECFIICCVHTFWYQFPADVRNAMLAPLWSISAPKWLLVIALFWIYLITGVGGAYVCQRLKLYLRKTGGFRRQGQ